MTDQMWSTALFVVCLAVLHSSHAQIFRLRCPDTSNNPLTCTKPRTCNDIECGQQDMTCCAVDAPGECGRSCVRGIYVGCFETNWFCYGTDAVSGVLPQRWPEPAYYIDNQNALDAGIGKQIEYYASRAGVEVEFLLLQQNPDTFHWRETSFRFKHTAAEVGQQEVKFPEQDWWRITQSELRFAFRTTTGGEFPIPYTKYQSNGVNLYNSFIDPVESNGVVVVTEEQQQMNSGVNIRFMARICLTGEQDVPVDNELCDYNPPEPTTTGQPTSATASATTSQTTSITTSMTSSSTTENLCGCPPGAAGPPGPPGPSQRRKRDALYVELEVPKTQIKTSEGASSLFSLRGTQVALFVWNSALTLALMLAPLYMYCSRSSTAVEA